MERKQDVWDQILQSIASFACFTNEMMLREREDNPWNRIVDSKEDLFSEDELTARFLMGARENQWRKINFNDRSSLNPMLKDIAERRLSRLIELLLQSRFSFCELKKNDNLDQLRKILILVFAFLEDLNPWPSEKFVGSTISKWIADRKADAWSSADIPSYSSWIQEIVIPEISKYSK